MDVPVKFGFVMAMARSHWHPTEAPTKRATHKQFHSTLSHAAVADKHLVDGRNVAVIVQEYVLYYAEQQQQRFLGNISFATNIFVQKGAKEDQHKEQQQQQCRRDQRWSRFQSYSQRRE